MLEQILDDLLDLLFGMHADELVLDRALLKEQQRGYAPHRVLGRFGLGLVHVHGEKLDTLAVLTGQSFQDRRDELAGLAPRRPEIDDDKSLRPQHFTVEIVIGQTM